MSTTFADLGVPTDLAAALAARGFKQPFDIQSATIPDAMAGRDVCGRAPTGSGKTVAFGVPLLARISRAQKRRPTALVLVPTRELAAQIARELEPLADVRSRRVATVYGGVGYEPQRRALQRGVDVLVACPGRLADLIGQRAVALDGVEVVVVDEADRMADMGFLPEVRRLLAQTPSDRQTLLFSATLDGAVAVLTRDYQHDPARHDSGGPEPDGRGAHHLFWRVENTNRADVAVGLLGVTGPAIVFCRTRRGADRLSARLGRDGVRADAIHGGRSQSQRDRALAAFKAGTVDALVATDVAARGIHVDGVACVVHFDSPEDEKAYLHRSGRTARAGASGVVVSFVPRADRRELARMQRALDIPGELTAPDLDALAEVVGPRDARAERALPGSERPASGRGRRAVRGRRRRYRVASTASSRSPSRRGAAATDSSQAFHPGRSRST